MRKLLLLLGLMIISLASCSSDEIPVEQQNDTSVGETMRINISFKTTYAHSNVTIYDVENERYVDIIRGAEFSNYYELEYKHRYILKFTRDNGDVIDNNEPFVGIYIKNVTNGKIIDEYELEGCTLGYTNNFLIL